MKDLAKNHGCSLSNGELLVNKLLEGIIRLVRLGNCCMAALSIFVAIIAIGGRSGLMIAWENAIIGSVIAFMVCAGGNTLNDYFDIKVDKINKPDRPLPSGVVKKEQALLLAAVLFTSALYLSSVVSHVALAIVSFASALLVFYNMNSKKLGLAGNLLVSLTAAMIFAGVGLMGNDVVKSLYTATPVFLIILSRELVKAAEDVRGDSKISKNSFPIKYGISRTIDMASLLISAGSVLLVYLYTFYGIVYLVILLPALYMFSGLVRRPKKISAKWTAQVSKNIKIGSLIAILALFISGLMG